MYVLPRFTHLRSYTCRLQFHSRLFTAHTFHTSSTTGAHVLVLTPPVCYSDIRYNGAHGTGLGTTAANPTCAGEKDQEPTISASPAGIVGDDGKVNAATRTDAHHPHRKRKAVQKRYRHPSLAPVNTVTPKRSKAQHADGIDNTVRRSPRLTTVQAADDDDDVSMTFPITTTTQFFPC